MCQELSLIKGRQGKITLGKDGCANQKSYSTDDWNPILIAVARGQVETVKLLFEHVNTANTFHVINTLSKPYSAQAQKKKAFDHY